MSREANPGILAMLAPRTSTRLSTVGRALKSQPIFLGFGLGALLILAGGVLSAASVGRLFASAEWVRRTLEVLHAAQEIRTALAGVEAGTRTAILTGSPEDRAAAETARQNLGKELGRLTQEKPRLRPLVAELALCVRERVRFAEEHVRMDEGAAIRALRSGRPTELSARVLSLVRQLEKAESELLTARQSELRVSFYRTFAVTGGTTLLGVVLLVGAGWYAVRQNRQHQQARTRLEHALEETRRATAERDRFFALSIDMLVISSPDGTFKFASPGVRRILGFEVEEFLAMPYLDQVHPDDRDATMAEVVRQVERGEPVLRFENRYRHKDGSWRVLAWSSMAHSDGLMYAIARDVTEAHRTREAMQALTREAERANLAKSQFLANMSHELRTPLNSIIGFSEMLEDRVFGELNEKQARYVRNVLSSGRHLLELINDILDLSKIESGRLELHPEEMEVAPVLEGVLAIVRPLATKKSLHLAGKFQEGLPVIRADRSKFKQIFYNLLSNAVKFTPDGGRITVTAEFLAKGSQATSAESDVLQIRVADTGIGIRPEDQERVWKEFEQVDSSFARGQQGTGLGLALTRRLVEQHGGHITLHSSGVSGEGCVFTVDFPLAAGEGDPESVAEDRSVAPQRSDPARPLVLVVEDDASAASLLSEYLTAGGYDVALARDGTQAIAMAEELQPFAITLDILLPDRIGWEVLGELKKRPDTADIPVVVVTITEDRQLGLSLGALDFLVKPIGRDHLLNTLAAAASRNGKLETLLIVEDEPEARATLVATLEAAGFRVLAAVSGEEALERMEKEHPDAAILDLNLPGMAGFELVRRLRLDPRTRSMPILIYTGRELSSTERAELGALVQGIAAKPAQEQLLEDLARLRARVSSDDGPPRGGTEL